MAAVDPKEIVLQNKPLVAVYVLAILPLILWFPLVSGGVIGDKRTKGTFQYELGQLATKERSIKTLQTRIAADDPADPVYTKDHVDNFIKQKQLYVDQLSKLKALIEERDKPLERWFEKFQSLKAGQQPDLNEYRTHWAVEIRKLVEEFRDLVVPEGEEAGSERIFQAQPRNKAEMSICQKRFWIQKSVLEAIRSATKDAPGGAAPAQLVEACSFVDAGRRGGEEAATDPVKRIRVRFAVLCSFRSVPPLVRALLAQEISMQVVDVTVQKHSFYFEDQQSGLRVDGRDFVFRENYYTAELPDATDFKSDLEAYIPEPRAQVTVELEVLDFDPGVIALPAPAAAGEEGQE